MENVKLTTQQYWHLNRESVTFKRHEANHAIDVFIQKFTPKTINGKAIEIGSFPGPHLATFGDLGYELNGIDFHPDNAIGLPLWLKREGFKTGDFLVCDFFDFKCDSRYDVVSSFGFIEHFLNYEEVIGRHTALVNKGGYLLITTPNFRGSVQKFLHKYFDKENLALHNLDSMNPDKWAQLLKIEGFEILFKGHFGGFWFWRGSEKLPFFKRKFLWVIQRIVPRLRNLIKSDSSALSAYCGIAARKM